ncbi:hypothetical protein D7B24_000516 [Verticillium nonalfalfae]|uniref:Uncharacterized protein n=1 Tax=Verticillium nonalfalfae TaxID=1051616 RepID=A0A3M9Y4M1_9PEZI|nr:uncharacterized protein D7B24_000516 [Verticillium nonalfalfae]RNJ54398.1 hypothetical protein D7B24_000516 [Verticillium nonalfalfae]
MPSSTRPKLPQLATPVTGTFPSEAVFSVTTPMSARPMSCVDLPTKTPISPPTAYMDFLKSMSVTSPGPRRDTSEEETATTESLPSTATSEATDCSCKCEHQHKVPASAPAIPPSPFTRLPMSAPPNGDASFPSLKIPPSPAFSHVDSPMSATPMTARSPFSARSVHSVFDWDAALKARFAEKRKPTRTSVRHIREVVTRTVTYNPTPKMNPAPKGKRRKVEHTPA